MRQTKFRGWSSIEKKWVYGSLLQSEIDVNELSVKCQIHERFADDFSIAKHDVIPESVGQFTGLLDKKLKEIYEKDILKCLYEGKSHGVIERVEFNKGCFILRHRTIPICEYLTLEENLEVEVIGNIFQNLELIIGNNK